MRTVKLGDVADVNWGDTSLTKASYVDDGYVAYSATGADGFLPYFHFDREAVVLSAIGARCGKTWFASGKWSAIKNTIRFWSESKDLDNRYLYWVTNDPKFWPKRGAAQPFITIGDARKLEIALPPIADQRSIATILDQASALRHKRINSLRLLTKLPQAIFAEMFGTVVGKNSNFNSHPLGALCTRITDGTHQAPKWASDGIPFIFVSNIRLRSIDLMTDKFVSAQTYRELTRSCPIEMGDVLYTTVGSYGNSARIRDSQPFVFQRHIAHIKPNVQKIDSHFLEVLLETPMVRRQADRVANGVAQKTVTLSDLKNFLVICPPMALQRAFADRVNTIDDLKNVMQNDQRKLNALFGSLQHRALSGELTARQAERELELAG